MDGPKFPSDVSGHTIRFVVFNDLHTQFAPSESMCAGYPGADRRAEWLLNQVASGGMLAEVDFVLSAGDLIHGESLPAIAVELTALRARLGQLPVPTYPCCGNHEIRQGEGDAAHEAPYRQTFGDTAFDYSFMAGACEILVLNNAGSYHLTKERRWQRYEAFKRLLQARPGVPKILVCHIPLVAVREEHVLRESFGFVTYKCLENELLDVLEVHGCDVKLVVSGHLHLTGMVRRGGIYHLVTSGTASFPHDYALITVTPESIAVDVQALPAALHEPRTNLHGRPRYSHDYSDAIHLDAGTYLSGQSAERNFTIPLRVEVR